MKPCWRNAAAGFAAIIIIVAAMLLAPDRAAGQDLQAMDRRMAQHFQRGNYAAALEEALKLEVAIKARFGIDSEPYMGILTNIAFMQTTQGRYEEAEQVYKFGISLREKKFGTDDVQVAHALLPLGNMYVQQSRYSEAEPVLKRALAIVQRWLPEGHDLHAKALNDLAVLQENLGRYAEAERLYNRAIRIMEAVKGSKNSDLMRGLTNLGGVYQHQGRYEDAVLLYRRVLPVIERNSGKNHPDVATVLTHMAGVAQNLGSYNEAEKLLKRALPIVEKSYGANHPETAAVVGELGAVSDSLARYRDAETFYRRALAIYEASYGAESPDVALMLNNLSITATRQSRHGDAEGLLKRVVEIQEAAFGPTHARTQLALGNLTEVLIKQDRHEAALPHARRTSAAIVARATADQATTTRSGQEKRLVDEQSEHFRQHLAALAGVAPQQGDADGKLALEAYDIAQWASQSSAAAALQQMAARFAGGGGALADLIRLNQDVLALARDVEKARLSVMSTADGLKQRGKYDDMRKRVDTRLQEIAAQITKEFPDYAELTSPKPLTREQTGNLLGPDEALVFFLAGAKETHAFAVTREAFWWKTIPLGADALSEKVAAFRRGLDIEEFQRSLETGKPVLFDVALAHELYVTLFGPVEPLIRDKRHLLVVPSAALTALPFALLVTAPTDTVPLEKLPAYRDVPWLIKRQAITMLPSVASLKALRVFARKDQGTKPFIGFGDPVFGSEQPTPGGQRKTRITAKTRSYSEVWRGAGVDRDKIAQALQRLEDTADELKAVAEKTGGSPGDIHLREQASEAAVKKLPIGDYRVVYFATHGLVAGDVKGLGEPSLALTTPSKPSDLDDGLLTASEIAQLKLNADWIVLSACNTAAGEKPGAEAFSGLARAFFYAGARALLVSHWAVDSAAATRLTTSTFDILKGDPTLGRSEALRRAMLAFMEDKAEIRNAYPAYWAPFAVIGEGASR
jgi:CHAT domain-containing protein/tetratricopeptide (TPR) repeat protein